MKKFLVTLLTILIVVSATLPVLATDELPIPESESIETVGVLSEQTEEPSEMDEKQQEQIVLILIIIGMVISLGTLYTLKFISHRKENSK